MNRRAYKKYKYQTDKTFRNTKQTQTKRDSARRRRTFFWCCDFRVLFANQWTDENIRVIRRDSRNISMVPVRIFYKLDAILSRTYIWLTRYRHCIRAADLPIYVRGGAIIRWNCYNYDTIFSEHYISGIKKGAGRSSPSAVAEFDLELEFFASGALYTI